jgi:hypothetical protein
VPITCLEFAGVPALGLAPLFNFSVISDALLVISSAFLTYTKKILRIVRQLILLVVLLHIILGVELGSLALLEHLEVFGCILNDVGRLVT